MINRFFKIINSKFSRFFKFIFFLRYLFVIFFISIVLYLAIPSFFNYKKKEEIIKLYLIKKYSLEIQKIDNVKYQFLPVPQLILENLSGNLYSEVTNFKTQKLTLYPKFLSLYNHKNFDLQKIKFDNSELTVDYKKIYLLTKSLINLDKKFFFNDLQLKITEKKKQIINFEKISLLNYGYKKNTIKGKVFNRKFKIKLNNELSKIYFELLNTGVIADLNLLKKQSSDEIIGDIRGKILDSNFKTNFTYESNKIVLNNFFFRSKDLAFTSDGKLEFKPFFGVDLNSKIKRINPKILSNINIEQILYNKDFIKKLNIINNTTYKSQKFSRSLINEAYLSSKLSYGRLNITKKYLISKSLFNCKSDINLLDEYPVIYFKCNINSPNKKDLLKKIGIDYKTKNETIDLNLSGNLNILNNKVNFDNIIMNDNYNAPEEDLKYFKEIFENLVLNKKFQSIFELQKIRSFLKEII